MLSSLVMSIFIRQITGAPLPTHSLCTSSTIPLPLSTLVDVASCAQSDKRSLWDIVWGCSVTIFSCTWIAIHPNIPGPDDSRWRVFRRGVTTMICALIAPELIMAWALRQHAGAGQIMHRYNEEILKIPPPSLPFYRRFIKYIKQWFYQGEECDRSNDIKWTKTHGFFIQMGGFMLYKDGEPVQVLTYRRLEELIKEGQVDVPRITERTINDKSKSDYLSKGFVVLQTTWFVVQCIARQAKSLPLAELEVFTLAFAILNAIIYAIWFDKPQNVQEGLRVDLKPVSLNSPDPLEPPSPKSELPEPLSPESELPEQPHNSPESWLHRQLLKDYHHFRGTWFGLLWFIIYRIPCRVITSMGRPINKLVYNVSENWLDCTPMRMPMFGYEVLANISTVLRLYLPCLIGLLYGLLHVIAWNSGPTKVERQLWRYSTIIITIDPLLCTLFLRVSLQPENEMRILSKRRVVLYSRVYLWLVLGFLFLVSVPAYGIARVALIAQALASLRQLPPATFCDVAWSSFIPHL